MLPASRILALTMLRCILQHQPVVHPRIQLVGTVCLYVAAVYLEVNPYSMKSYISFYDGTYTDSEFIMVFEQTIRLFNGRFHYVTSYSHLLHLYPTYSTNCLRKLYELETDGHTIFQRTLDEVVHLAYADSNR